MKNFFKRFIAVIASVLIFCISVVPSSVSAYTSISFTIPFNYVNNSSLSEPTIKSIAKNIYSNQSIIDLGYTSDNSTLCIYESDGTVFLYVQKTDVFVNVGSGCILNLKKALKFISYSFSNTSNSISDLLFHTFTESSVSYSSSGYRTYNLPVYDSNSNQYYIACINSNYYYGHNLSLMNGYSDSNPDTSKPLCFIYNYDFPFNPITDPLFDIPYNLDIQKQGFIEWLISSGRWTEIPFSIADSTLSPYVDYFSKYGGSGSMFVNNLNDFLSHYFESQVSNSVARQVLSKTKSLYAEYLRLKNDTVGNHLVDKVNKIGSVDPVTSTDNKTLITDKDDDSTIISILRDILRSLLSLPSVFSDCTYLILNKLDSLNLTTNFVNDFSSDADRIIDSINNISVDVPDITVDVNITDERQKEIDDFFTDWNLKYSNKLNEKIPVASQLSDLFSEDFFEKCGIDVNEDGEVYEYYHPELATLSSGSVSADQKLVNDFISNFDGADTSFLNDVQYSSDVPDFSITIQGEKHSIFNFNLYARYRTQIHTIMIFCIYSLYFLSLFKSLPNIIGNVSDVKNAFSDYHGGDS